MSAAAFAHWLDMMKVAGLAHSDAAAGRLLGISPNSVVKMKQRGQTDARRWRVERCLSSLIRGNSLS